jgi:hypothetical protein
MDCFRTLTALNRPTRPQTDASRPFSIPGASTMISVGYAPNLASRGELESEAVPVPKKSPPRHAPGPTLVRCKSRHGSKLRPVLRGAYGLVRITRGRYRGYDIDDDDDERCSTRPPLTGRSRHPAPWTLVTSPDSPWGDEHRLSHPTIRTVLTKQALASRFASSLDGHRRTTATTALPRCSRTRTLIRFPAPPLSKAHDFAGFFISAPHALHIQAHRG